MTHRLKPSFKDSGLSLFSTTEWPGDVVKAGNLRKLKKLKRKFFVIRKSCGDSPAKLEYYPSEKKWRSGCEPKKSIVLKTCFNVSKKLHPKHKYVICLYSHSECFSLVTETEEELDEWLSSLLELQLNEIEADESTRSRPVFEHVWQVIVDDRELEFSRDISGPYCLGLTSKSLSLIKTGSENFESFDFPLMSIRRCGHSGKHFFIELGRSAITGAGGVWMETEGTLVAQNMHETILSAMKSSRNKEELGPHTRPRSASNSENSKPIATRRPVGVVLPQQLPTLSSTLSINRDRSDALPPRARTISENMQDAAYSSLSGLSSPNGPSHYRETSRPHSLYAWPTRNSPVLSSLSFAPSSLSTSMYSSGSNMSFDDTEGYHQTSHCWYSNSQGTDGNPIPNPPISEAPGEYLLMSPTDDNMNVLLQKTDYLNMNPSSNLSLNTMDDRSNCDSAASSPRNPGRMDYMDMRSPSSSNPESYIPMSIIGSLNADSMLSKKLSIVSVNDHTQTERTPTKDGYVPMAPGGASEDIPVTMQDGYLSMSPLSSSLPKQSIEGILNSDFSGSNSTVGSNVGEFKLDKVQSLLMEPDDYSSDFIKPVRAYSIGSRSQIYESRARAYSMGSERPKPSFKASAERHVGDPKEINFATKSSSAPLLQHPVSLTKKSPFSSAKESGYDLMEIDYRSHVEQDVSVNSDNLDVSKKSAVKPYQRSSGRPSALLSFDEADEKTAFKINHKSNESNSSCSAKSEKGESKVIAVSLSSSINSGSDYVQMCHTRSESAITTIKEEALPYSASTASKNPANNPLPSYEHVKAVVVSCPHKSSLDGNISLSHSSLSEGSQVRETISSEPLSIVPVVHKVHAVSASEDSDEYMGSKTFATEEELRCSSNLSKDMSVKIPAEKCKCEPSGLLKLGNKSTNSLKDSNRLLSLKSTGVPVRGDYINLMLSKPPEVPASGLQKSLPIDSPKRGKESSVLPVPPTSEPNYMNIKLGKPYMPLPNPALVSSAHPCASDTFRINRPSSPASITVAAPNAPESSHRSHGSNSNMSSSFGKSAAARGRTFCFQSLPIIRKQMSAPAVPPSLQPEAVSPGRKSSCPVTASASMLRPSVASPACSSKPANLTSIGGLTNLFKMSAAWSPNHNGVHPQKDKGSSNSSSPKTSSTSIERLSPVETPYENISFPIASSSSNSRPSSVSSEKELNYASLDLAPNTGSEVPHSPCMLKLVHQQSVDDGEPLTYAEIDFTKSEGLRHTTGALQESRL